MPEIDPLLAAVEALTKPQRRKQEQEIISRFTTKDDDGIEHTTEHVVGTQKVTVTTPPLLELLDDAIRSSMGGSTKGAALASESAVLNVRALYEAIQIATEVADWCRLVKVIPTRQSAKDLSAWYASTRVRDFTEAQADFYTVMLRKWAGTIWGMMDPWREQDIPDPCPTCGATEWWDPSEDKPGEPRRRLPPIEGMKRGRARPLLIRYKRGQNIDQSGYALCRACEAVFGVRELRFELERRAEEGMTTV